MATMINHLLRFIVTESAHDGAKFNKFIYEFYLGVTDKAASGGTEVQVPQSERTVYKKKIIRSE